MCTFSTADLCDHYLPDQAEDSTRILSGNWQWFGARRYLCGEIVTLEANGCNAEVRAVLAESGAGRVLVIEGGARNGALLGDNLANLALRNDWAGVMINGNVRDSHALASIDLGILALGCWPQRSENKSGGARGVPLQLGGHELLSGEWLYADDDGVLISRRSLLNALEG